jgi:type I restriction enzyme S subunit
METTAQKIDLNHLDKSNWESFRFEEIAKRISETVDPNSTILETYVGLEHIDSQDIHVRRKGIPDDVSGGKLKCYPGDVIFGKRRAYQRKAAIVDFFGICSAHAFVFRANPEVIYPNLFPFFLHSDQFMNRMIDISVGGLSPTINWGDLKHQEFLLPPKDQQAQLAELLWAMDEVIEREKEVFNAIDILFKNKAKYISDNHIHKGQYKKIKEVCFIKDNMRKPLNSTERDKMKGDIPYYGANGLVDYIDDFIFEENLVLVAEDGGNYNEFYDKEIAYRVSGKSWVNNHAHVLVANDEYLSTEWLFYSLVHKNILKFIIGTTRLKLNKSELEKILIWLPSSKMITKLSNEMNELNHSRIIANQKLGITKSLQKSVINQVF